MRFQNLAILPALLVVAWVWYRRSRDPHGPARALVRGVVVALLVLAAAGMMLRTGQGPIAAVLIIDQSASMPPLRDLRAELTRAARDMRPDDRVGVVLFGVEPRLVRGPAPALSLPTGPESTAVATTGSNIDAALRLAAATLPTEGSRRLVLVSDGLETSGDARRIAARAASTGISIDVLPPARPLPPPAASVTRVSAPPRVRTGEPFTVTVTVEGRPGTHVEVTLRRDDTTAGVHTMMLPAGGVEALTFAEQARPNGVVTYVADARLPDDELSEGTVGGTAGAVVVVDGEPRVLHVGPESAVVEGPLRRRGFSVMATASRAMPRTASALGAFDVVLLDDVRGDDLDASQSAALHAYVEQLGGGVVVLGTPRSLEPDMGQNAGLADLLPIDLRPRRGTRAPAASIVVVFDKSGSMDDLVDGAPKIEYARQAAQRVLTAVSPTDRVGIVAFDAVPVAVAPLAAGHTPASLAAPLRAVRPGGATAIAPALHQAAAWLQAASGESASGEAASGRRQILLLSDGRTTAADAAASLALARRHRVQVSVVALGDGSDRAFLGTLARESGGRAYFPADVRALPQLLAREASRVAGGRFVEDPFRPRPRPHPMVTGFADADMPFLGGYVVGTIKPAASVAIASALDDPVLATASRGLGRVAVYAADLRGDWSAALRAWPGCDALVAQMVRWAARGQDDGVMHARFESADEGVRAIVDAQSADGVPLDIGAAHATVRIPSGEVRDVDLLPVAPGRYEARIAATAEGPYVFAVEGAGAGPGGPANARVVRGWFQSADREAARTGVDRDLLTAIALTTRGRVLGSADSVFTGPRDASYVDISRWLAVAALLIFLLDAVTAWPTRATARLGGAARRILARGRRPADQNRRPASTRGVRAALRHLSRKDIA